MIRRMTQGVALAGLCAVASCTAVAGTPDAPLPRELGWPAESNVTRPWTFWHWMGNAADSTNVTSELQKLRQCGLGGVLIVQIQDVRDPRAVKAPFLSSQSVDVVRHTIRQARTLGMNVDLCPTTGWEWGGPWVKREDSGSKIGVEAIDVPAGGRLDRPAFVPRGDLQSVMAYSGDGRKVELLDKVDADGRLNWTAPADQGNWTLYPVRIQRGSCRVRYPTLDGDGYVANYLCATSMVRHLERFAEAFAGFGQEDWPRAWYDDSWEADMNWSDAGLAEFQKRRGYDLREHLPAFCGRGAADENQRVRRDFLVTTGEMMLDGFFRTATGWLGGHHSKLSCETIDHPGNILDMAGASGIPFADVGGGLDWWFPGGRYNISENFFTRHKIQSSAAHVMGRPLVGSETMTCWVGSRTDCGCLGFGVTLRDFKWKMDLDFIGGVNHTMFHSMSYSPSWARWPGYIFGAETQCGPFNPYWPHLAEVNRYISRCQAFLQEGRPDADLLFFYPCDDLLMQGRSNYAHFGVEKQLFDGGYDFDYVSDSMLLDPDVVRADGGRLVSPGSAHKALVVGGCKYMDDGTLQRIFDLAEAGGTIVIVGEFPGDVPGMGRLEERRARLRGLVHRFESSAEAWGGGTRTGLRRAEALRETEPSGVVARMRIGAGQILKGADLPSLMNAAGVRREAMVESGLRYVRRRDEFGAAYFIASPPANAPVDGWVPLGVKGVSAALFDPMTGVAGMAAVTNRGGQFSVRLQVEPAGSVIVRVFDRQVEGAPWQYTTFGKEAVSISGTWKVEFLRGGEELPAPEEVTNLSSWTTWTSSPQIASLRGFSGIARYSIQFDRPAAVADDWILDLGDVRNSARVVLNGTCLGTVYGAPNWRVSTRGLLKPTGNLLEVEVANLAANRVAWLDANGIPWRMNPGLAGEIPRLDRGFVPLESGLLGPVRLVPASRSR